MPTDSKQHYQLAVDCSPSAMVPLQWVPKGVHGTDFS